jgi:hypothetical protein
VSAGGREFEFLAKSNEERERWVSAVKSAVRHSAVCRLGHTLIQGARNELARPAWLLSQQLRVKRLMASHGAQAVSGGLILAAYGVALAAAALRPSVAPDAPGDSDARAHGLQAVTAVASLEMVLTTLFAMELALHVFSGWMDSYRAFCADPLQLLDVFVVAALLARAASDRVPPLAVCRLVRLVRLALQLPKDRFPLLTMQVLFLPVRACARTCVRACVL